MCLLSPQQSTSDWNYAYSSHPTTWSVSQRVLCGTSHRFGSIDPYVKVLWDEAEIGESDVKWKSQRPRFDYHVQGGLVSGCACVRVCACASVRACRSRVDDHTLS